MTRKAGVEVEEIEVAPVYDDRFRDSADALRRIYVAMALKADRQVAGSVAAPS